MSPLFEFFCNDQPQKLNIFPMNRPDNVFNH